MTASSTSATPRLETAINACLAPLLRAEGFKGSGRTFRRIDADAVYLVNVEAFYYGGRFAVNVAVHPLCLPDSEGLPVTAPARLTASACEFRTRLEDGPVALEWEHDSSAEGMMQAMREVVVAYERFGRPFFALFSGADSVLNGFDVAALRRGDPDLARYCFGSTIRVAYIFSRLRSLQQRKPESMQFAALALELLEPGPKPAVFIGYAELLALAGSSNPRGNAA